ncbi:MAG: LssY C-terminal domain-containing protein [Gemmatimonadota bacterium]|nr:LssY C-terminal domain-containing protein [Gemmatimonadota bacterium]
MTEPTSNRERWHPGTLQRRIEIALATSAVVVIALVYTATHLLAPALFTHFEHAPELAAMPKRTTNAKHVKGDPVNLAAVGTLEELTAAMRAAGWTVAAPANRSTDIAIARSVIFNRPDSAAPVSPLYLFDRAQDIAFEREVGHSARSRHHARFWLADSVTHNGRPIWLGDATFDLRAGLSHRGFHPTHHIAPDVDEERDTLVTDLIRARQVAQLFTVSGMGIRVESHNAEGDRFDTDGEMAVVVLSTGNAPAAHTDTLPAPAPVVLKDRFWRWAHAL